MEFTWAKILGGIILQGRVGNKAIYIVHIKSFAEVLKC